MARVDRRLVAIIGAAVVAIAATLLIVFLAIVPVPEFKAIEPGQEVGSVAYLSGDQSDATSLKIIDLASTESISVDVQQEAEVVGWDDQGNLILHTWMPDRYALIDPTTGEEVGILDPDEAGKLPRQDQLFPYHEGDRVFLERPDGESASFTAPDSYDIRQAVTLGEDRIAFVDELGRVAVTSTGENVHPLLIASDASEWTTIAARA